MCSMNSQMVSEALTFAERENAVLSPGLVMEKLSVKQWINSSCLFSLKKNNTARLGEATIANNLSVLSEKE